MNTTRTATLLTVFFAVLCVLQVSLIAKTLDKTRAQLSSKSTGAINSLTQIDRNLDHLMQALISYRLAADNQASTAQVENYQEKFEIFWASATVLNLKSPGTADKMPAATTLLEQTTDFLNRSDSLIHRLNPLTAAEATKIYSEARMLSEKFHELGHDYFLELSMFSDELKLRTARLYNTFLAFTIMLLVCGAISMFTMSRENRKSIALVKKSNETQEKLTQVVDELRSGKLENKAKDSFLAAASHDLRQPLHALGLFLGALQKHVQPSGQHIMEKAQQSSSALNKLLSSLLDLSRLDAGVIQVRLHDFNIGELLAELQQEFQPAAKNFNVTIEFDTGDLFVHSDQLQIDRILRNLIDNALKHSRASLLQVRCTPINHDIMITVSDDGIGIPVNSRQDIFSEYFQLGNPERDRSKGLGLGLSIVRRLSELLDADLKMESQRGTGCTFSITLPRANAVPQTEAANSEWAPAQADKSGILIAIIEDQNEVRAGTEILLNDEGYEVVSADSAFGLLKQLSPAKRVPDVLISDYRLRYGNNGVRVINEVNSKLGVNVPSMIITGDTSPRRVHELGTAGFELLHKPVEPADLLSAVERITSKSTRRSCAENRPAANN